MNQKTYHVLEYHKILGQLAEQAASGMAREAAAALRPLTDEQAVREKLAETSEAAAVLLQKGNPPLGSFYDIDPLLSLARKGGSLTMGQLLQVLYNLNTADRIMQFLGRDLPPMPVLDGIREVLYANRALAGEIDRCILSEEEISDQASPRLRSLRRAILRQNESIRSRMNQILSASDNRSLLQDAIVTLRQGRYVIPVKQEHRSRFPGIVHDQSQTGATLFVEPQAIVDLNNELRQLELEEQEEIRRILAELSAAAGDCAPQLKNNQKLLVELDLIFAKGKLSLQQGGFEPRVEADGPVHLLRARHPLIKKDKAVPVTILLGDSYRTLVVTGPNTGGKTVTLKTAGLLCLMAQTGLHIPAEEGSRVPVFRNIFADIGDEQSIEQNLSTFSSHMNNIADIVRRAGSGALVLLDELGAGTDPTEGAALAIAILEDLHGKGARTIATTHYTELKKYALATAGVENASMEFDVETLRPTYRLLTGIPGKSNAFEISRKIGLDEGIIRRARERIDRGDLAFEQVLETIEADRKQAERDREEALLLKIRTKKEKEALDSREKAMELKQEKLLSGARDEAGEMLREAREILDRARRELRRAETERDDPKALRREIEEGQRQLKKARQGLYGTAGSGEALAFEPLKPSEIGLGVRVKIVNINQNGVIASLPDEKGDLQVQAGPVRINVNVSGLMLIPDGSGGKNKPPKKSKYGGLYQSKVRSVAASINVIGKNLDDARMDVDKYLDDAYMAGLREVSVIHGRGEGVLKEGLAEMFRKHRHVESFRRGTYHEGGEGVTVCTLSARV